MSEASFWVVWVAFWGSYAALSIRSFMRWRKLHQTIYDMHISIIDQNHRLMIEQYELARRGD